MISTVLNLKVMSLLDCGMKFVDPIWYVLLVASWDEEACILRTSLLDISKLRLTQPQVEFELGEKTVAELCQAHA
jgi:hypothetical protein